MSDRLRVVFVIQDLRLGGAERHAVTLMRELADRGHVVAVVCVEAGGPLVEALTEAGVPVVQLGLGTGWKWRMRVAQKRVGAALSQLAPQVVMTSGYSAEVLSRIVLRGRADVAVLSWKHNIGHLGRIGIRDLVTERLLGRYVTRYLAVSFTQLAYLRGYLRLEPARTQVLRNAVSLSPAPTQDEREAVRRELGVDTDHVVIGCVAVLRPEKDHATLIDAFAAMSAAAPRAVLVLVGDGPLRAELTEMARRLGVVEATRFLGSRDDVPRLLAGFDIAVLASQTVENLPYSLLEAMGSGLPVVSTAVGALAELVDDGTTGWLVPPKSAEVLARQMGRLVKDPVTRSCMGRAARQRISSSFALEEMVSATEQLLREVTGVR